MRGTSRWASSPAQIAEAGGALQGVDLVPGAGSEGKRVREFTIDARDQAHWEEILRAIGSTRGRPGARLRRPDAADAPWRQDRAAQQVSAEDPRRPLDGLHARGRTGLPADRRRPLEGVRIHDQAQHRRRRLRRQRGARPRRHRPRGRDAGDGGKGDAVQGVRQRGRLSDLPQHPRSGPDREHREADVADLRGNQPRGHLGAALLRDRGAAQGGAGHPRLPRRPARNRGGGDGGAVQRAEDRRQEPRGPAGAGRRPGRRGRRGDQDDARLGSQPGDRLRPPGGAVHRARGLRGRRDERDQALVRRELESRQAPGLARRRDRGLRPVHRRLRARDHPCRGTGEDVRRRDRVRDGKPQPRGDAGGRPALRADHGDGPLRLSEPDQQRALLPGHLPGGARRRGAPNHRGDEAGGGQRHRSGGPRGGPERELHHSQRLRPRRGARGGRGGGRGGAPRRVSPGSPRRPERSRRSSSGPTTAGR